MHPRPPIQVPDPHPDTSNTRVMTTEEQCHLPALRRLPVLVGRPGTPEAALPHGSASLPADVKYDIGQPPSVPLWGWGGGRRCCPPHLTLLRPLGRARTDGSRRLILSGWEAKQSRIPHAGKGLEKGPATAASPRMSTCISCSSLVRVGRFITFFEASRAGSHLLLLASHLHVFTAPGKGGGTSATMRNRANLHLTAVFDTLEGPVL